MDPSLPKSGRSPEPGSETTAHFPADEAPSELVQLLDAYMAELQAGRSPDRDRLIAEHPQLAEQLAACLAGIEFIQRAAKPAETLPQLGDFRIVREVGRGGMGVVYEAEQQSLGRRVALKVLRFGNAGDVEAMQRFEQEARTVAHLHHTNIVPIFAIGCEQGVHYYAMQFIEGRSLASVAQEATSSGQPCSPQDVARWGLEAAEALAHAHQRGVIHRDVKPSNLLLDADGRLWLTDFGLARRMDEVTLTVTGALMGTPRYMSPEQATTVKHPVDHRTDIYSLGATLYELATGKPVFDGETAHVLLSQILTSEPISPRRVRADLPRDLETIILKCLAKETSRRYASAAELADDLRSFSAGRAIRARRPSLAERVARWSAKQQRTAAVAVATLLLTVVSAVAGTLGWTAYRESLNGTLTISTAEAKVVAEVLAADDDTLLVPSFSLPTQQPIVLPEGEYRLRLAARGQLGETYRFSIERDREIKADLNLGQRELLPPIELPKTFDLLPLGDHSDLIVRTPDGARRVDGRNGQTIWEVSFTKELPYEKTGFQWDRFRMAGWDQVHERAQLVSPPADLNGDGVLDLVWIGKAQASLLAVSGKDGQPLWLFHERAPEDNDLDQLYGQVLGQPVKMDVDDDDTIDFALALVARRDTTPLVDTAQVDRLVVAISGRTGKELWRQVLDPTLWSRDNDAVPYEARWFGARSGNSHNETQPANSVHTYGWTLRTNSFVEVPSPPQLVSIAGQPRIAVVAGSKLLQWTARDGMLQTTQELGLRPVRPPQVADLDGDGQNELLLTRQADWQELELIAWSLADGKAVWQTTVLGARWGHSANQPAPAWPVIADLDGDTTPEIIIPIGGFVGRDDMQGTYASRRWGGLTVIKGKDGSVRPGWPQKLVRSELNQYPAIYQMDRFTVGSDIDGDGARDLFAATGIRQWFDRAEEYARYATLQIDARSGTDGHLLWFRQIPLTKEIDASAARVGSLAWGPIATDGFPQLLVNYVPEYDPNRRDTLYCLSASTGVVLHEGADLRDPQVADLNGDGLLDIACLQPEQIHRDSHGKLRTIRGTCHDHWRRLGAYYEATDLDGDGMPDLQSEKYRREVISSRDGHLLWRAAEQARYNEKREFPQMPLGDFDGDGTPDALYFQHSRGFSGANVDTTNPSHPLSAVSGRTGRFLWQCDMALFVSAFGEMTLDDLDGDGAAEVLLVIAGDVDVKHPVGSTFSDNQWRLWLVVFSGRDGKLRWKQPLSDMNTFGRQWPEDNCGLIPAVADLDGDGVRDVVIGANTENTEKGAELRAFHGRTGELLWRYTVSTRNTRQHLLREFPRPVVGDLDHDGRTEVVVLDTPLDRPPNDLKNWLPYGHDEVITLDGRSGEKKWHWRGEYQALPAGLDWSGRPAQAKCEPLLVNLAGDGRLSICIWNSHSSTIALIGPDGTTVDTRKVNTALQGHLRVWCADFNGDGKDELLFPDNTSAVVTRGGLQESLWRRESAAEVNAVRRVPGTGMYEVVVEGARFESGSATGTYQLVGLAGASGEPRWLCDYPNPRSRRAFIDIPTLAAAGNPTPRVLFLDQQTVSVVRQAFPVTAAGRFEPPSKSAGAALPPAHDPRLAILLPWQRQYSSAQEMRVMQLFQAAGLVLFAGVLLYQLVKNGARGVIIYLCIALGATVTLAGIALYNSGPLDAGEHYSWNGWYLMIVYAMGATGLLIAQLCVVYLVWDKLVSLLANLWMLGPGRFWLSGMRSLGRMLGRLMRRQ